MPKFCSECGTKVSEEDTFCSKCGFNLKGTVVTVKSPAPIPPRTAKKKNSVIAAILNFFLWGIGYVYLGKWWGIVIFIFGLIYLRGVLALVEKMAYALTVESLANSVAFAWHAYKMAEEMKATKKKSPSTAAILNFFLLGIGYVYLGKWWGIVIFTFYLMFWAAVSARGMAYDLTANIVVLAIDGAFALHAYKMAEEMKAE